MWGSDYIFIESPRGLRQGSEGSFCIINERASTHCLLPLCQNKRAGNVHVWIKSWGVQYISGRFVRQTDVWNSKNRSRQTLGSHCWQLQISYGKEYHFLCGVYQDQYGVRPKIRVQLSENSWYINGFPTFSCLFIQSLTVSFPSWIFESYSVWQQDDGFDSTCPI